MVVGANVRDGANVREKMCVFDNDLKFKKNKGDAWSCDNYRGIKMMSHTMKLWEIVVEAGLRAEVSICEHQYGFMPKTLLQIQYLP